MPPSKLIHVWSSRRAGEFGKWHELIRRLRPPVYRVRFGVHYRATGSVTVQFGVGPEGMEEPWMEIMTFPGGADDPVVFERDVLVGSRVVARAKSARPHEIVEVRIRLVPKS